MNESLVDTSSTLIKTDTEGCETMVMKGASWLLENHHPLVVCEIHWTALKEMGSSQQELAAYMRSLGYKSVLIKTGKPIDLSGEPINYVCNVLFAPEDLDVSKYFVEQERRR